MGYDMECAEDGSYFRLNISGMGAARNIMFDLNMVNEEGDLPAVQTDFTTDAPGIPVIKLCSNDGWHVHATEIESALAYYRIRDREQVRKLVKSYRFPLDYWDAWIDYLEYCAKHDGFLVW